MINSHVKPINLCYQRGVPEEIVLGTLEAITETISLAQVSITVTNFGTRKQINGNESAEWYLNKARTLKKMGSRKIHSTTPLQLMLERSDHPKNPHYDVVLIAENLCDGSGEPMIGATMRNSGIVISTQRSLELDPDLVKQYFQTEAFHQLGHLFGLIPPKRTKDIDEYMGFHCANKCSMAQATVFPKDWVQTTANRLLAGPFCDQCTADLRAWFR